MSDLYPLLKTHPPKIIHIAPLVMKSIVVVGKREERPISLIKLTTSSLDTMFNIEAIKKLRREKRQRSLMDLDK